MKLCIILVTLGVLGVHAQASKPIPWTMKGCVTGGVFYSIDADREARAVMEISWKSNEVSKLEGKWIEVAGLLYPGDFFKPRAAPPVVKRNCTAGDRKAVEYAKADELRMQAARIAKDRLDDAIKLIEASIALVSPADCDSYIDRAHFYARKNDLAATARDLRILETRACRFRRALNWLLLQELGNELRKRDAKAAVRALTLAKASCDFDGCRDGIARDLAAAKAAAAKK